MTSHCLFAEEGDLMPLASAGGPRWRAPQWLCLKWTERVSEYFAMRGIGMRSNAAIIIKTVVMVGLMSVHIS